MAIPKGRVFIFFRLGPEPAGPPTLLDQLRDLYATQCPVCGGFTDPVAARLAADLASGDIFDSIVQDIAQQLYDKKLSTGTIPRELYEQTADRLMQSVFAGMGGKSFDYDDPNNTLLAYFRQNTFAFSAAKSLNQVKAFNDLLIGPDGKPRTNAAYAAEVAKTGALFNKTHLATEQDSAIAQSQMAQAWDGFGEEEPIEIRTAGDSKVRPEHAQYDGLTVLKSDALLRRFWPPFDWKCRCYAIPGLLKNVKKYNAADVLKGAKVPEYFQSNSGITKTVFDEGHPHFLNAFKRQKELTAEGNYAMQSVPHQYEMNDFPAAKALNTKGDANDWWADKAGGLRGNIDVVDKLGNTLRFDNDFRNHVLEDNKEGRHAILSNMLDIVKHPDEVWSIRKGGKMTTTYIRYYEGYPYAVQADGTRPYTMFSYEKKGKLNETSIIRHRRGVLMYRKN